MGHTVSFGVKIMLRDCRWILTEINPLQSAEHMQRNQTIWTFSTPIPTSPPHEIWVLSAHLQHRWACLCAPAAAGLSAPSGWACIDSKPQRDTGTPAPWTHIHSISDKPARKPSRQDRWATANTHMSNLNCRSVPPEHNLQFCSPSTVVDHVTLTTDATSSYGYGVSGREQDTENQWLEDCDRHAGSPQVSLLISPVHSRVFSWRRWALGELPHESWPVI